MTINIDTVYPCESCQQEINPLYVFCPLCGEKQTPVQDRTLYNIFYRWRSETEIFYTPYGVECIILSIEDIKQLAARYLQDRDVNLFIGTYVLSEQNYDQTDSSHYWDIKLKSWTSITKGGSLGQDAGPQSITLTNLE